MAGPTATAARAGARAAPPAPPARAAAAAGDAGVGLRLFVAVPLPPAPAAHLAQALGREPSPQWHLTLAFLGERPDAAAVTSGLTGLSWDPFEVALAGAGTFGGRVLWVGIGPGRQPLTALAQDVQRRCGVDEGRPYVPHLTVRRGRDLQPGPLAEYAGPAWAVDSCVLFESRDGRHSRLWQGPGQEASKQPG